MHNLNDPHTGMDSEHFEKRTTSTFVELEGGRRGWCTAIGGWLVVFATFGYSSSFGVFQAFYVLNGTSTASNISWIGSTQLFFITAVALPAGYLLDKGHFKVMLCIGTFIYVFSLFMLSLINIHHYYQAFLAQGVGMGIGAGLLYVPSIAIQTHHWKERRASILGLVITGTSVGGIVYPIMLNNLINGRVGFAWGVRASAFLTLGFLLLATILMSDRKVTSQETTGEIPKVATPGEIIKDKPYLLVALYFFLQLYTELHGLPHTFAFYTLTIQNGASIFGRIIPNIIADKYGVLNVSIFCCAANGIIILGLFGVRTVTGVVVFAIFYGFFSGGSLSLGAPLVASFVNHPNELGIRFGISYIASSFGLLIGPPIAGALVGNGTHWAKPIIFSAVVLLAGGSVFALFGRRLQVKRKGTPYALCTVANARVPLMYIFTIESVEYRGSIGSIESVSTDTPSRKIGVMLNDSTKVISTPNNPETSDQNVHGNIDAEISEQRSKSPRRPRISNKGFLLEGIQHHTLYDEYGYELMYPEILSKQAMVEDPRVPSVCIHKARRYVLANVRRWRDTTDILFLLAGLLSAVLSIFTIYTYESSRSNYNKISKALLSELAQKQTESSGLPLLYEPSLDPALILKTLSTPRTITPWVTCIWFISVSISLSAALFTASARYRRALKASGHVRRVYRKLDDLEEDDESTSGNDYIVKKRQLESYVSDSSRHPTQTWKD